MEDLNIAEITNGMIFTNVYPAYLKLWKWSTKGLNNFTKNFPKFKYWEGYDPFKEENINKEFGIDLENFTKEIYKYHYFDRKVISKNIYMIKITRKHCEYTFLMAENKN